MAVQNSTDLQNFNIVLSGETVARDAETVAQDATRTEDLVRGTVMAQNATTKAWEPLTDVTATDGTAVARGIFMGDDIAAADLVAGDVE